ncbi:LicD family-domain-containing protein [Chytriomyces cf. hyalinus JEL632]|nr:LicD family-domain-containing protein [Chytriomyces cf. hyalinus JEL632]
MSTQPPPPQPPQPPQPRKHRSHLTLAAGVTVTLLLGLAPLLSVQTLPSISPTNRVSSGKSASSNDWQQFSAEIAMNAAIIEVESVDASDSGVQPEIGLASVDVESDSAHSIPPSPAAEKISDPLVEPPPSKLEQVKFEYTPTLVPPVSDKGKEYKAAVSFYGKSYISNLDLHTASYSDVSPYYENTTFLNTPIVSGENSFKALARMASYDTGKLVTIPRSHFNLSQPFPNVPSFNPEQAIISAVADKKYFYECGADLKRDYRYTKPEDCQINNKVPSGNYMANDILHNLQYAQLSVKSLMKAWIDFSQKNSIVWWVSHGELLGWAWNGNLLPWDLDWDLQMTTYQLVQLVAYNQTLIDGRFFIDVNPSIYVRTRQPNNIIDARVIDTWTGYFVDITGVSHLDRTLMNKDFHQITYAWNEAEEKNRFNETDPERVYCKSIHRYSYDDLMPLHETMLAGLKVWRPRAALKLIVREYSENALIKEKYTVGDRGEVYAWDRKAAQWNISKTKSKNQPSRWGRADEMETAQVVDQPGSTATATSSEASLPDMGSLGEI